MSSRDFYERCTPQSKIKIKIVAAYFRAWANIFTLRSSRVGFADLYSGPGRYRDGTPSTPLEVLRLALDHPRLPGTLVSLFNDMNPEYSKELSREFQAFPGIEHLTYKPTVMNKEVGEDFVKFFGEKNIIPTLLFLDPWGYKGLTRELVGSVVKGRGCDCIFFFNFRRIKSALYNKGTRTHIEGLYGVIRTQKMREELKSAPRQNHEEILLTNLDEAFAEIGFNYTLPFRIYNQKGALSQHLIFVCKHQLGYDIMKDVMAKRATSFNSGIASFEYDPRDEDSLRLFTISESPDTLFQDLPECFAGQKLTVKAIYEMHNTRTPFLLRDYQDVLKQLEAMNIIEIDPPAGSRKLHTLKPDAQVTFH